MIAKIRHLATHTERYDTEFKFYQTIFGMKQITTGLVDDTGKSNPDRGHISDGVIAMALLGNRAGVGGGSAGERQRPDHPGDLLGVVPPAEVPGDPLAPGDRDAPHLAEVEHVSRH